MAGIDFVNQIVEDEHSVIHISDEELSMTDPVPPVIAEGYPTEPEHVVEEDPEEGHYEGDELGGFSDGPLPAQEDVIMELTNKNMDLEERIQELEEEYATQQHLFTQHQSLSHYLLARNVELGELVQQVAHERDFAKHEKELIHAYWDEDVVAKFQVELQREEAMTKVNDLEAELRRKDSKMDRMSFAFETAMGRWRSRIRHYPVKEGRDRRLLGRKRMLKIGKEEYRDAKKRGMLRE